MCIRDSFYGILERKNAFLGYKNKKFKKSKIWHFLNGLTHGFGPKMAIFPFVFLGNESQESVFYDILEQKNAFQGYKNKKFQKSKNCHFLKALTHGFGPKMAIFPTFFLGKIGQENVFYDILERKNVFLGYKNKHIKISKKCHFSKLVNPRFWFKNGRFLQFLFFGQYRPGQSLLRYSRTKNAFQGYKNN